MTIQQAVREGISSLSYTLGRGNQATAFSLIKTEDRVLMTVQKGDREEKSFYVDPEILAELRGLISHFISADWQGRADWRLLQKASKPVSLLITAEDGRLFSLYGDQESDTLPSTFSDFEAKLLVLFNSYFQGALPSLPPSAITRLHWVERGMSRNQSFELYLRGDRDGFHFRLRHEIGDARREHMLNCEQVHRLEKILEDNTVLSWHLNAALFSPPDRDNFSLEIERADGHILSAQGHADNTNYGYARDAVFGYLSSLLSQNE